MEANYECVPTAMAAVVEIVGVGAMELEALGSTSTPAGCGTRGCTRGAKRGDSTDLARVATNQRFSLGAPQKQRASGTRESSR